MRDSSVCSYWRSPSHWLIKRARHKPGKSLLPCVWVLKRTQTGWYVYQFSRSVVSDSLRPHGLQHNKLPCSCVWLFMTPQTAAQQASLSITNSQSLLKLMSIESVMPSYRLILSHPLLFLPSIFPSIRVFSSESTLLSKWPKYWSFSFNISPSIEHPGLISFRMDWLDLLAVQGTLKNLLQLHSSKASILCILQSNSHIHTWLLEKP